MRLEPLCAFDLQYTSDFHLARPYGNESGIGWGVGAGPAADEQLYADMAAFDLTGRTVFVDRDGEEVGRQLLLVLLESEDGRYAWLNNAVCVGEGVISPETMTIHLEVSQCVTEI